MKIKLLSEKEYTSEPLSELFEADKYTRCYGLIEKDNIPLFKLAWRSDLISPNFVEISPEKYIIGIDNNVAIIDFNKSISLKNIKLQYNYIESIVNNRKVYIATDLEVLIFEINNINLILSVQLPDSYDRIFFRGKYTFISCANDLEISLEELYSNE